MEYKQYLLTKLVQELRRNPNLKYKWLDNGALKIYRQACDHTSDKGLASRLGKVDGQVKYGHVCHGYKGEGLKYVN